MGQTLEILLKLRKEGGEVISQLQQEVTALKTTLNQFGQLQMGAAVETALKNMAEAAGRAQTSVKGLTEQTRGNPAATGYLAGLADAYATVDKAALKAATQTAEFQKALASGGDKSAWALGVLDSLKQTATGAEEARAKLELVDGVSATNVKAQFDELAQKLEGGLGAEKAAREIGKIPAELDKIKPQPVERTAGAFKGLEEVLVLAAKAWAALQVAGYIKDSTLAAARTEVLGTVLKVMGSNAGMTAAEIDKADRAVQKMGITASSSRQSLAQMLQSGLDVSKYSSQIARASQDLAVVMGENSSATMQRMITNVSQMDTMGLRFMGITTDLTSAEEKFAQSLGKTADQLTDKQRKEALLVDVLDKAKSMNGLYEASMQNAGKAMSSLSRYTEELSVSVGNLFLPALLAAVTGVTEFLKGAREWVEGLEGADEASAELGATLGTVIGVLGDLLSGVGTVAKAMWEHRDVLVTLAGLYAAGLGISGALRAVQLLIAAVQAGTAAIAGMTAAAKAATLAEMVMGIGTLVGKIPGLRSLGAAIETVAVAMAGLGRVGALLAMAGGLAAIAGMAVGLATVGKAAWDARKALDDLEKKNDQVGKRLKAMPKEAIEGWRELDTGVNRFALGAGDSLDDIKDKTQGMIDAMKAGALEYQQALMKIDPANLDWFQKLFTSDKLLRTEKDIEIIESFERKMAALTDEAARAGERLRMFSGAGGEVSDSLAQATREAVELQRGFKTATEYANYFWQTLRKLNGESFSQLKDSAKQTHDTLKTLLSVDPEKNWDKALAADRAYYAEVERLARQEHDISRSLLDAETADKRRALQADIQMKKDANQDATDLMRQLSQLNVQDAQERLQLEKQLQTDLTQARNDALNAYVDAMRRVKQAERDLNQENLNYEIKKFDLTNRLNEDRFKAKEDSLRQRERDLQNNQSISAEQREAMQRQIAAERNALTAEREADQKRVEGLIQNKVNELIARAKDALAKGDLDTAKSLTSAAEQMSGRIGTVQGQLDALNKTHEVRVGLINEEKRRAEESAIAQQERFLELDKTLQQVAESIRQMTQELTKFAMESRYTQMMADVTGKTTELNKSLENQKKLREEIAALERSPGSKAEDIKAKKGALDEVTKSIDQQRRGLEDAETVAKKFRKSIDDIKPIAPTLNNERIAEIDKKLADLKKRRESLTEGKATIEVDANTGKATQKLKEVEGQKSELSGGRHGLSIPVDADTATAKGKLADLGREAGKLTSDKPKLTVETETDAAGNKLKRIRSDAEGVAKKWTMEVDAETGQAKRKIYEVTGDGWKFKKTIHVDADAAKADKTLERVGDKLDDLKEGAKVPVAADTAQADQALDQTREAAETLQNGYTVEVDADASQADQALDEVLASGDELRHGYMVEVDADTEAARANLDDLDNTTPEVAVEVTADDTKAEQDLRSLDAISPKVEVAFSADTREVERATQQINNTPAKPLAVFEADNRAVELVKRENERTTYSDHIIRVHEQRQNAAGGYIQAFAEGGMPIPPRAAGYVSGFGTGVSDSIFSLLSNGEFVLKAAAVQKYGIDFLYAMNNMALDFPAFPRFAEGGAVSGLPAALQSIALPPGGSASGAARDVVDLNFNIGGTKYPVQSSRETAKQLATALRELSRAS